MANIRAALVLTLEEVIDVSMEQERAKHVLEGLVIR